MKLRIAEKIFNRYLELDYKLFNQIPPKHKVANPQEQKALKICKKFKGNEYWPFKLSSDGTIIMIIGG